MFHVTQSNGVLGLLNVTFKFHVTFRVPINTPGEFPLSLAPLPGGCERVPFWGRDCQTHHDIRTNFFISRFFIYYKHERPSTTPPSSSLRRIFDQRRMSMTKYVLPSHLNPFHTNLFPSVIFTRIPLHSTANIQVLPLDRREGYGV
jgi:hypothetical protein